MPHKDPARRKQYQREWQAQKRARDPDHAEKVRVYSRTYQQKQRQENPEKAYLKKLAQTLKQYGLTPEEFSLLEYAQCGVCAICGMPERVQKRLSIDHDHHKGKKYVRGLLCNSCNNGLGRFGDNPEVLRRAVAYLEGYALAQSRLECHQAE